MFADVQVEYAEIYNVEYALCRFVQCRVCRHVAIPDGIRLHLGMEILSLTTRSAWASEGTHKKQYFGRGILVFQQAALILWYFDILATYFGILLPPHDTKMAFFCGTDSSSQQWRHQPRIA